MSNTHLRPVGSHDYSSISDDNSDHSSSPPKKGKNSQKSVRENGQQSGTASRGSVNEGNGHQLSLEIPQAKTADEGQIVTWASLPHKGQLALLTFARLSEPLVQSSLRVSTVSLKALLQSRQSSLPVDVIFGIKQVFSHL
jgi:hypothetical protein